MITATTLEEKGLTPFVIHCSPGSDWIVGFKDKNGNPRFLPYRKKFWGSWTTNNCPTKVTYLNPYFPTATKEVLVVSDGMDEDLTPKQALEDIYERFHSVEEYLGWLNG